MSEQNYQFKQNGDKIDILSQQQATNRPVKRSSPPNKLHNKGISDNLGVIIKIISFIIATCTVVVGGIVGLIVYRVEPSFASIAVAIFIFSIILATISLFIFYAIGQIICQNNAILRKLNNRR